MELLILSPSVCVGSTHQWEVTQSSSSLARSLSSVLLTAISSSSLRVLRPCRQRGSRSSAGRVKGHFRRSWQMHLRLLLARCWPQYRILGRTFEGWSDSEWKTEYVDTQGSTMWHSGQQLTIIFIIDLIWSNLSWLARCITASQTYYLKIKSIDWCHIS